MITITSQIWRESSTETEDRVMFAANLSGEPENDMEDLASRVIMSLTEDAVNMIGDRGQPVTQEAVDTCAMFVAKVLNLACVRSQINPDDMCIKALETYVKTEAKEKAMNDEITKKLAREIATQFVSFIAGLAKLQSEGGDEKPDVS